MSNLIKSFFLFSLIAITAIILQSWMAIEKPKREYYQLAIYHYNQPAQEKILDHYFQFALLPALNRMNIKNVGVFKNHANDTLTDKTMYLLIPTEWMEYIQVIERLNYDKIYQAAGSAYLDAVYSSPPYSRIETLLLRSFSLAPQLQVPKLDGARKDRVYELRSYESATEKIFRNKVHMFNEGDEIGLFKRLNFNAAFYGEVIAGSKMPNLMYMTCHENRDARNANWKKFVEDPYWKKLSSMPEYQHNVSHIDISFLYPTEYSGF